ncbi:hypothetical protein C7T35_02080 [Variovorax sp. WS11]|uniref:hypothetical protein n=1 Tax=Variovorax sp. WS11 TaxID=1105204 RepID=UPI000D0DC450|nr:hypothetical protein [Variovorax sp. WS11]PSL86259.1 hypothetical protein C7T35_02080 [Variovorax sp. WS11]
MSIDMGNSIAFTWPDAAGALLAAQGITEGLWFVGVSLNFAGGVNPWKQEPSGDMHFAPTGLVGIQALVIAPADGPGPMVFDAAELVGRKFGRRVAQLPPDAVAKVQTVRRKASKAKRATTK